MAAEDPKFLSDRDRRLIEEWLKHSKRQTLNTRQRPKMPEPENHSPEVYVARALTAIDARVHGLVSSAECQVYRIEELTSEYTGTGTGTVGEGQGVLVEVEAATQRVYNMTADDVEEGSWLIIHRDKWGDWVAADVTTDPIEDTGTGTQLAEETGTAGEGVTVTKEVLIDCPVRIENTSYYPRERWTFRNGLLIQYEVIEYCTIQMCCEELAGTGSGSTVTGGDPPITCITGTAGGDEYLIAASFTVEFLVDDDPVTSAVSITYDAAANVWSSGGIAEHPCPFSQPGLVITDIQAFPIDGSTMNVSVYWLDEDSGMAGVFTGIVPISYGGTINQTVEAVPPAINAQFCAYNLNEAADDTFQVRVTAGGCLTPIDNCTSLPSTEFLGVPSFQARLKIPSFSYDAIHTLNDVGSYTYVSGTFDFGSGSGVIITVQCVTDVIRWGVNVGTGAINDMVVFEGPTSAETSGTVFPGGIPGTLELLGP